MSRADIKTALDTAGLTGWEAIPNTLTRGQGWPEWVRTTYSEAVAGCLRTVTEWVVWVVLPPHDTEGAADQVRDQIALALADVAAVDTAEPALITVTEGGGNTLPAIRYQIRTTP